MATISDPKLFPPTLKNKIAVSTFPQCADDLMFLNQEAYRLPALSEIELEFHKMRGENLSREIDRLKYMAKEKDTGVAIKFYEKSVSALNYETIINYIFDDCEIHEEYEFATLTKQGWRFFPKSECATLNKPIHVDKIGDVPTI